MKSTPGRDDEAVVGQFAAAGQLHHAFFGIDAGHHVAHQLHAVALFQVVVRGGDVGHGLVATEHQVGDRAGYELGIGLDQGHLDRLFREQADVFGRGRAGIAAADHDHFCPTASSGR